MGLVFRACISSIFINEPFKNTELELHLPAKTGRRRDGLCKGNRVEKGFKLFKEMRKKDYLIDRAVYGSLIEAFVVDGKVGSACDLLKDLIESGYRADLSIYNSLIEGLCNMNRVDKAYKLLQVIVQEGIGPDFATVNPILVSFVEVDRMDDFCTLLEQMQKLGLPIIDDLSKFFSFMVGKRERVMRAVEEFKELKTKGYSSIAIYNVLMGALHKIGEVKAALSLFNEIKDSDLKPDSSITMKERGWVPTVVAYCSLAKGLCKIGEIDAALMLVRDCLGNVTSGPMKFKYALTILHVCKSGDAEKVIEVLKEMMQQGCPADEVIYSAITSGMCKHGTLEEARKVFACMRQRKLLTEANLIVYEELFIDHMKKKTAGMVLSGLKFFGLESKLKLRGSTIHISVTLVGFFQSVIA
ncbi:hypothetical protein HHK36_003511 [Tetracentron sinense]|uniref:Pentatricopeptide repeat-containing protein n=1 Tax=Tetracentron sinense TaxID=13715 RepID=A0A835DP12_TETSI|nr:hypothetical protein HHK36_003511 [Tetracentron sinense]